MSRLSEYDFLIFDTSGGIANPVIAFCMASTEVLLVITSDPTSITDAYALLKVLFLNGELHNINAYLRNGHSFPISKEDKPEPRNSKPTGSDAIILDYEEFLKNRIERKGGY